MIQAFQKAFGIAIAYTKLGTKRIAEMGLNPGAEISVCQRSGSGLLVSRSGTRLALGGGMAHRILVCAV